jgi:HAD superfamily hydrolase (TIGR01549 family)
MCVTELRAQDKDTVGATGTQEAPAARAVIFDLYGTLADIEVDEESEGFWNRLAESYFAADGHPSGVLLARAYRRLIREQAKRADVGFLLDAVFAQLLQGFAVPPSAENLARFGAAFRRESTVVLRKKVYTDELLLTLSASGYRIGMASNTEALLTAHDLEMLRLPDVFDALVLSSAVDAKKPEVRIFEIALDRLHVTAAHAVFIGNSYQDDALGALGAGLKAIYLTDEPLAAPYHYPSGDSLVCSGFSLAEILAALAALGFPASGTA